MSVSTTLSPVNMMASEVETSFESVETQIEERTVEMTEKASVSEQTEATVAVETAGNREEITETSQTQASVMDTEVTETTAEVTYEEEETSLPTEVDPSGNDTTESSANETRGPDEEVTTEAESETEAEVEMEAETEEATTESETGGEFDLASASKEEVLAYIESLGGNDSDAFYDFLDSLDEDSYNLVWIAQYGNEEDVLSSEYEFDYDSASDLDAAKWIRSLEDDEFYDVLYSMTFEQYRRYLSIREMIEEIEEKDFSDVIDEEAFTPDRSWDYESYDAFAEALTGVSLQRTEQTMQFYNTYVDPSQVQAGVTTIDSLLDSNTDWYSEDYLLSLNPQMFKETVPVYYGADGNYYVISSVPTLNGIETADYQPATSFYNGSIEAQAFTDISYLGNGVYQIPESRYRYCFMEQYVSDLGILYGITFGLRIQVLYGYTPSGKLTLAADVLYPDMTERLLPATLNLTAGTATVKVFNDDYDDTLDHYLVSASINRGASLPSDMGTLNGGKTVQFAVDDASAVGSLDILIGYNATSKYSMAAEITTQDLYSTAAFDADINLASELYNGMYLKLAKSSVPSNLAVGDKFVYKNIGLTIVGVNTCYDLGNGEHIGASVVPTHDAQSFCFYNRKGVDLQISSWFKTQLNNANSADPGCMVQMTTANISARAAWNGYSTNLRVSPNPTDQTPKAQIFGYVSDGLTTASCSTDASKVLNLEGTNVLLSCMHAWGNESEQTPQDIVDSVSTFTERTQKDFAIDNYCGHYNPNLALQCTSITDGGDGYTYATFKVLTSMLQVGGVTYARNYQCAFSTLRIAYENPKTGYLQIHKSSADPTITNGNICYSFDDIDYGVFTDAACVNNIAILNLDENGYSKVLELTAGTYYVREAYEIPGSGYKTNGTVYTVEVKEGSTASTPVMCETKDVPLNDPFGIVINKINSDGTTTADLSGAEYTITYYPKQYTTLERIQADIEADSDITPTIWVIKTTKNANGLYTARLDDDHIASGSAVYGKNSAGTYVIPLGTITVKETKAPAGFTTDGAAVSSAKTGAALTGINGVYLFNIVDENSGVYLKCGNALSTEIDDEDAITLTYAEVQNKAGISLTKCDATTGGKASGDADLAGIMFAIVNNTGASIVNYAGYTIANGAVAQVITTNSNGYAATGASDLPIGSYIVRELRKDATFDGKNFSEGTSPLANDSYQWQKNEETITLTDADAGKLVSTKTFYDSPVVGVPKMEKHDLELNKKAPMAGVSFEGITFEIYNYSDTAVVVGGVSYEKDEVVAIAVSDAEGTITTTASFPIGHYYMKEKSVNNQYTMTQGEKHYFNVVSYNGAAFIQYEPGYSAVVFEDRVVRGDLSFVKKNAETDEALAYIPFQVTNTATGETHYIVTDADGNYTSAGTKTTNTNANDEILSKYGDKDVIPQSVIDSLVKDAGLWFGLGSDGTMTDADDSYGSFVYGTYTITELKTEATRSMKMCTSTFTIDTDGKILDLGTVKNIPMGIGTTLVDANEAHYTEALESVTLTDHVSYKNLDTDKTYTLTGTLYAKDGESLTALATETVDFKPSQASGTQDVTFTFDASDLAGKSVVAFEELSVNGEFCAEHKNPDDENQTVSFPSIQTTALDSDTEDHVARADDSITIVDTIVYCGLKAGDSYTVTGTLMDQDTGNAVLDDNGEEITASKTFTAPASDGSVEIAFVFAGASMAGKTVVAFEELQHEGRTYAVHADLSDEGQTVYFPEIHTLAKDANTGINQVKADSNATVVDTVSYTHLLPGRTYTMRGVLMTSAGNVLMINGQAVTASTEFTPRTPDGTVDVTFNFDASGIGGRKLVFYEYLDLDGITVASHTDISDASQTVYVPSIRTTLIDSENGSHNSVADREIVLVDTVRYNGAEIGRRYTVQGTLVDKETQKEILDDAGNTVTASTEFVAEKTNGTVDITFKFSGVSLAGKTVVAFEHMYTEGKEVAVHADLRDEGQTEYFPSVHTTATASDTQDHVSKANEKVTITDQVALKALKLGVEYTVSGTLMDAETEKTILVNGNTITARRTFTADAHEMTIPLTYTLDASELAGTTTVVFENLYSDGALLASHADVTDAEQTVYIPEIHTTAKDAVTDINHTEAKKEATIVDTVFYTDLLPGREYTVSGTLVNKATGAPIMIGDEVVCASITFTPSASTGSVDVLFTFDASAIEGTTVVAFESMTYKGIEIAVHADITDEGQTVYIPKVRTTAISGDTKDHVTEAKKDVTIVDTVSYEGLEVGREYTLKGVLMNKATGKAITVDGKNVTAEATFTAETAKGSIDLTFTFDGSELEDTLLVVFETLYTQGKEVGVHADINDDAQTVYLPKIRTNAKDAITEIDHTEALPMATIIDTVTYSSLLPGKEYTVTGTLMNKATGEPIMIGDEPVCSSTTFIAETAEGSVEIVFMFDASAIAGTTVVAFESMEYEGVEVAVHADIEDEDQTVYIPDVHTTATASDTQDHVTGANETITITDEVALTGLKIGNEYTVKGVLMDKTTGNELTVNGESIVAETVFTADEADMTVSLTYTLDASALAGTTTVVFETLYTEGKEVGRHHEIEDEEQTIYIPQIHTTAADKETEINHTEATKKAVIVDTVLYSHLLAGKEYTVKGQLINKATGEPILIDGELITAQTTFKAEKEEGSVDVIFEFDASAIAPTTVVAFESLEYKEIGIAVHADIEDEDQTVYVPDIHTTALAQDTGDHIEKAKEDVTIVDTVAYEGLEIGREYTVKGILMDKESGEAILVDGEEVTAEETFTAEAQEGSIDITFTFDASALAGKSVVAFETLYTEEKEVAVHADIEDEGQTVHIPEVHTTATDKVTGDHDGVIAEETTVLDEVFYKNLIPGKEYTVKGILMVKETGELLTVDGKETTAEKTFTAEEADGSIMLEFTFSSLALAGKHVVAFEDIEYQGISIATHADLEDEDQTISYPKIHTTAADQTSGSRTMTLGATVTLVDTVTYKGLTAGKTYVVKGTVIDKVSGQPIGVTAETTFTAEETDGSVDVLFTLNTENLQGKTLVVFEELYDTEGNLIASHSDPTDEDQTVTVPVKPVIPPVVTGDDSTPVPYVLTLLAALLAAGIIVGIMARKRRKQA